MRNNKKNKLKSSFIKRKKEKIREIYIQEYLRGYRSDLIIKSLSELFLIAPSTLYEYIRPARLQKKIAEGQFKIDDTYESIIKIKDENS